ncbi:hypothetical protein ACOSOMT5_P0634 [Acidiphilium sp. MT5]
MVDDQWLVAKIDRRMGLAMGASGIFTMAASVALFHHDISYLTFAIIVGTNAIVIFVGVYAAFKRAQRIRVLDAVIHYAERHYLALSRQKQVFVTTARDGHHSLDRWLAELGSFIDQYTQQVTKKSDIEIIHQWRAALIAAIDRLVSDDPDDRSAKHGFIPVPPQRR